MTRPSILTSAPVPLVVFRDAAMRTWLPLAQPGIAFFTADAGTDVCTSNNHGLADGTEVTVRLSTTGEGDSLPSPLLHGATYFIRDAATNTFKLALTSGGAAINITTAGQGTFTLSLPVTGWSKTGTLPAGISFNTSTGAISGTPTELLTTTIMIAAESDAGNSEPVEFALHVAEAAADTEPGDAMVDFDLADGLLTSPESLANLFAQCGDKFPLAIGFVRSGSLRRLDVTNIVARVFEDETRDPAAVTLFDGAPLAPDVSAPYPRYRITADFTGAGLLEMVEKHSRDEPPAGTANHVMALLELEVEFDSPDPDGTGELAATRTSKRFAIHLTKRGNVD